MSEVCPFETYESINVLTGPVAVGRYDNIVPFDLCQLVFPHVLCPQ